MEQGDKLPDISSGTFKPNFQAEAESSGDLSFQNQGAQEIPSTEHLGAVNSDRGIFLKLILAIGPILIVAVTTWMFLSYPKPQIQDLQQFPLEMDNQDEADDWLNFHPDNPVSVIAECLDGELAGALSEVRPGEPTECSRIEFIWEEPEVREPGAKVTGYLVYFGEENGVLTDSLFSKQKENRFVAENFDTRKQQYLYVRTVTDGTMYPYGSTLVPGTQTDNEPFNLLFEYVPVGIGE
jgi:hypothetical protein